MNNRWTAKMKGAEGYITREISQERGDRSSEDTWKLQPWSIRGEEEELILGRSLRIDLYPSSTPLMILFPNNPARPIDEVLTKAQLLSLLLYQIHCIGPVGFGFAHIYSEGPLKSGPYTYYTHTIFSPFLYFYDKFLKHNFMKNAELYLSIYL